MRTEEDVRKVGCGRSYEEVRGRWDVQGKKWKGG
jgi:hypothetical protein